MGVEHTPKANKDSPKGVNTRQMTSETTQLHTKEKSGFKANDINLTKTQLKSIQKSNLSAYAISKGILHKDDLLPNKEAIVELILKDNQMTLQQSIISNQNEKSIYESAEDEDNSLESEDDFFENNKENQQGPSNMTNKNTVKFKSPNNINILAASQNFDNYAMNSKNSINYNPRNPIKPSKSSANIKKMNTATYEQYEQQKRFDNLDVELQQHNWMKKMEYKQQEFQKTLQTNLENQLLRQSEQNQQFLNSILMQQTQKTQIQSQLNAQVQGNQIGAPRDNNNFNVVNQNEFMNPDETDAFDIRYNNIFEKNLREVSRLDHKRFELAHPWADHLVWVGSYQRHESVSKLSQIPIHMILKAIARFGALNQDVKHSLHIKLLLYCISKVTNFNDENDIVLKSLIDLVDTSVLSKTPLRLSDIDHFSTNLKLENQSHPIQAMGKYSFRNQSFNNRNNFNNQAQNNRPNFNKRYCYQYNKEEGCKNQSCKFAHHCSICGKGHPQTTCGEKR